MHGLGNIEGEEDRVDLGFAGGRGWIPRGANGLNVRSMASLDVYVRLMSRRRQRWIL